MVRLAAVRLVLEQDLQRILGNARLEKTDRGDAAVAAFDREPEPTHAFGRSITLSGRFERDLLGIRLEREDESETRRVWEPSRREVLAFRIRVDDHDGRRVLM